MNEVSIWSKVLTPEICSSTVVSQCGKDAACVLAKEETESSLFRLSSKKRQVGSEHLFIVAIA